jgi:hypothetical protein
MVMTVADDRSVRFEILKAPDSEFTELEGFLKKNKVDPLQDLVNCIKAFREGYVDGPRLLLSWRENSLDKDGPHSIQVVVYCKFDL